MILKAILIFIKKVSDKNTEKHESSKHNTCLKTNIIYLTFEQFYKISIISIS